MYAITASYRGPTDTRGSRFIVRMGNVRRTVPYDYAAERSGEAAIEAFVASDAGVRVRQLLDAGYRLALGTLPNDDAVAVITASADGAR